MALLQQRSYLSVEDYLLGERDGAVRHEYIDGDVYAMAGASRAHNTIAFNLAALIRNGLQPPCRGYGSDMKIHIQTEWLDAFYYPDLSVSCEEEDADDYYNEHPALIIEVLSPSTERIDKYQKQLHYRLIPSLQEVVLIHQDMREVWVYRRALEWDKEVYVDGVIELRSIGLALSVDAIYEGVGAQS